LDAQTKLQLAIFAVFFAVLTWRTFRFFQPHRIAIYAGFPQTLALSFKTSLKHSWGIECQKMADFVFLPVKKRGGFCWVVVCGVGV